MNTGTVVAYGEYCNVDCQTNHGPIHKKECKLCAAELHHENLFRQPIIDDCPISCPLRVAIVLIYGDIGAGTSVELKPNET